jgi:hypothetical protein
LDGSALNFLKTLCDLGRPGRFCIFIDALIETVDQCGSQSRALCVWQSEGVRQEAFRKI